MPARLEMVGDQSESEQLSDDEEVLEEARGFLDPILKSRIEYEK